MSAREVAAIDARAEHRAALVAREVAREALTGARTASDRAGELLAGAEARLYQFSTLAKDIERDTAARISTWATQGGDQPSLSPDSRFADQMRRRAEAEQHAAAARTAVATLAAALDAAERKFGAAEFAVAAAATSVMIDEARPLAERLMSARREAWALEAALESLTVMWFPTSGGLPRPAPVGRDIVDAINNREPPVWRRPGPSPETRAWTALRAALVGGDADARLNQ